MGHPCKFQRVSRLGSVTARHSSIGRQPNFATLNRERHLYSAGRPPRWALAHILVPLVTVNSPVTLTFELDLHSVKVNQHDMYRGQRSLIPKVIVWSHRHTYLTNCCTRTTELVGEDWKLFGDSKYQKCVHFLELFEDVRGVRLLNYAV